MEKIHEVISAITATMNSVHETWIEIYGIEDSLNPARVDDLKTKIVNFCDALQDQAENQKNTLIRRVEAVLKEIVELEQLLDVEEHSVKDYKNIDVPLVEMDCQLWSILSKYRAEKDQRMEKLKTLQSKKQTICNFLNLSIPPLNLQHGSIPTPAELENLEDEISKLEVQQTFPLWQPPVSEFQVIWQPPVSEFQVNSGIEVGARFTTRFDMKMNGLHVSDKSISFIKDGVASLIVQIRHTDHGDTITIPITQKSRKIGYIPNVVKSFYASLNSKAPIRVIRQPTGGQYAPLINYRYDGLYTVGEINNVFNLDFFEIRYILCLVRLPSQPQVYEMLPTIDVAPSEIIEIEEVTTDEAVEILEHSTQGLSDVD